jgi:AcrR family transcriptional regulator
VKETNGALFGLRERKKDTTRQRILDVAATLFRQNGFADTSIDDIGVAADISRKSLYNYMTSKEAIIVALVERLISEHVTDWSEPNVPQFDDARDVVAPRLKERLNVMVNNRWLLELAAAHTHYFNPGRKRFVHSLLERNFIARTERIAAVQRAGLLRKDVPAASISWYYEALRDLSTQRWLSDPRSKRADLHRAFDDFIKVLTAGLERKPTRARYGRRAIAARRASP